MSNWYNGGLKEVMDGTIDLNADTIKIMLVTSSYVFNKDHDFVDEAGANDPIDHELTGTGYTAGFGGSGRKTLASKVFNADDANDRAEMDAADVVWTAISAGTIAQALIIKEVTDDTATRLIAQITSADFPLVTNGGDVTIAWNAEGVLHITA